MILPVWHNVTADQVGGYSPALADRVAVKSEHGLQHIVEELLRVIKPASELVRLSPETVPTVKKRIAQGRLPIWKWRVIGLVAVLVIGTAILLATQGSEPAVTEVPPPEITGFTLNPPGPMLPGARIGIQVNVRLHGHKIDEYRWIVREGEGSIVSDQWTPSITYQAPETPGFYAVRVELEYEGGSIRDWTMVEVVPKPTSTPTPKYTLTPTATPTSVPLLPPPILLEPENEASFTGRPIILKWQWDRPLEQDEAFSLRVWKEGEAVCHHAQTKHPEYSVTDLVGCSEGKHYWMVVVVRKFFERLEWRDVSESSEKRWFYYTPGEEQGPVMWPTPGG